MSITSLWPFAQWGLDIVGPMPLGKGFVIHHSSSQLLHEVGGNGALLNDNGYQRSQVFVESHGMPIQYISGHHCG